MKIITNILLFLMIAATTDMAASLPSYSDSPQKVIQIIPAKPPVEINENFKYGKRIYGEDSPISVIVKDPSLLKDSPRMLGNSRGARLHIAPGAYPVYYVLARANGKFSDKNIRALSQAEIEAYNTI